MKDELLSVMRERGWTPKEIPQMGSTIVDRLLPKKV
jgi:hypothetical protein